MLVKQENYNSKIDIAVGRFDMALNFYMTLNDKGKIKLVTYDYNPAWQTFYPFYDDANKVPLILLNQSKAQTYGELINEHNKLMPIDIAEKVQQAKIRYKELIGNVEIEVKRLETNFITYEIKQSKTTNISTLYKFYNFVITSCSDKSKALSPQKLDCVLQDLDTTTIISGTGIILAENLEELRAHAI